MNLFEKILFWLFKPSKRKVNKMIEAAVKNLRGIKLHSSGFSLTTGNQQDKNYFWHEIDDIKMVDQSIVILKDHDKIEEVTPKDGNYYEFIQKIPSGFTSYDYEGVTHFFKTLTGCPCCGLIALKDNDCLACGFELWHDQLADIFESEQDYIKAEQHSLFDPIDSDPVEINNLPEQGFQADPLWTPLVSASDFK